MKPAAETLIVFLSASLAGFRHQAPSSVGGATPTPAPAAAASPSPSPSASPSPASRAGATPVPALPPAPTTRAARKGLAQYGFETREERSAVPLLRFEDEADVRSIEMNAAIGRYFDPEESGGDMMRGATPGGAPTLAEMRNYRPHTSPSADFLGLALWAVKGGVGELMKLRKTRVERNEELLRALLLRNVDASPSPTPTPSPTPSR
jgi:hypothetical protein